MKNENQEYTNTSLNPLKVLLGILIGGLVGAVTMLLLAPQSGKDTRKQIQEKGIELRDRTSGFVEDTVSQLRTSADKFTLEGREKIQELKKHGQEVAIEQLDKVSEAVLAGKEALKSS